MSEKQGEARRKVIEACGLLFEEFGLARSRGLVWALIYVSNGPISLDDIVAALRISKGSASTATRELLNLEGIRQVRVEGDRRDFFEASAGAGAFAKNVYEMIVAPRFARFAEALERAEEALRNDEKTAALTKLQSKGMRERMKDLRQANEKLELVKPVIAQMMRES